MTHTTIRLAPEKKEEFAKLCDSMGLSVSGAINIFVTKVLQCRCIPFEISAESDMFFSEFNQKILLNSISELEKGKGKTFNDVSEILADCP